LNLVIIMIALSGLQYFVQEYRGTYRYLDMTVGTRQDYGLTWTGAPAWVEDKDLAQLFDWIRANTEQSDVLAHGSPALMTFFTERPATLLPRRLDSDDLRGFLVDYRVSFVL